MPPGAARRAVDEALHALAARVGVTAASEPVVGAGRDADRVAGLLAARRALASLPGATWVGGEPEVLGHHADGCPRWPSGTTGSIAHAGTIAVACAGASVRTGAPLGVGIDIELAAALPAVDAIAVLDASERAAVLAHAAPDSQATRVWSAKEAAFKAWNTALGGGLDAVDPADIHVDFDHSHGHGHEDDRFGAQLLTVTATGSLCARVATVGALQGWCVEEAGYVVALVSSRAAERGPHHGVDGMASAATTSPSDANATK